MLQVDGRGFVKGTNTIFKSKVVVLKRFSSFGRIVLPGDVIEELSGDALASCLASGKVRKWNPEIDEPKKEEVTDSTQVVKADELGPKKKKKEKSKKKGESGSV